MDASKIDMYFLDDKREQELWKDCVFVFDTSALLDFYYYPDTTKQALFDDVFKKIEGRLWIPAHVEFEYLKNRKGVITKPIVENYNPLIDDILSPLSKISAEIKSKVESLKSRTKNSDKHPFIEQDDINNFEKTISEFAIGLEVFDKNVKAKIEQGKSEIRQLQNNDIVLESFERYFEVGEDYSFEKILAITREGKHRYEFDIPPGYEDLKKVKKEGTQIFGDLIVWKQILDYAKEKKVNVVFICNDVKRDWCIRDEKNTDRISYPREELIKEFTDFTGRNFWMYSQPQFIYTSNKLLKTSITKEQIDQISQVFTSKNLDKWLIYKCLKCSKIGRVDSENLGLEYEDVGGSERSMGAETQYTAESTFNCENCENLIQGYFNIWEYPVGAINFALVELDGAEVIKECEQYIDLYGKAFENEEYYDNDYTEEEFEALN